MAIAPLTTPPSRTTDTPAAYRTKADAVMVDLNRLVSDINTALGAIYAAKWVSGTTYAIGDSVWSPANGCTYRRKTAGAGTTDPSLDSVNYWPSSDVLVIAAGYRNAIVNGDCRIAQRGNVTALNGSRLYGGCDRIAVTPSGFTTLPAGAISQITGQAWTKTGYAQSLAAFTTTGAGTVQFDQRVECRDTVKFNGKAVTFSANVLTDIAGLTATAYIYKANAADAFGTSTLLGTGTAVALTSGTASQVSVTANLGATDASNGLECRIIFTSVGAVTTKNISVGDLQLTEGGQVWPMEVPPYEHSMTLCRRRYRKTFAEAQPPVQALGANTGEHRYAAVQVGALSQFCRITHHPPMAPTGIQVVTLFNPVSANAQVRDITAAADCSATTSTNAGIPDGFDINTTGAAGTTLSSKLGVHYTAEVEL